MILGDYEGKASPVRSPAGITYLMVTLTPGQTWTYDAPAGQGVAWLAVSHGGLVGVNVVQRGEMAIFQGTGDIGLQASSDGARFVIASAIAHPFDLVTGYYSVRTNRAALAEGEARIAELRTRLPAEQASGQPPVFRG